MKVVPFKSAESYEPEKHWKRVSLCAEKNISIKHFVKPPHHASPNHDHPNSQVLIVLKGKLTMSRLQRRPLPAFCLRSQTP